ncbi:hypothetical protein A0H81_08979 [Grifola frondosa]|uniref:Uncharacterized protein n=1 Tax=Grifola frondosa TaxID=5627 RepID=A0A1C7M7X5_GRIFR|nr:hypothetical protein A0H81_08979 [Grifola frondosa]
MLTLGLVRPRRLPGSRRLCSRSRSTRRRPAARGRRLTSVSGKFVSKAVLHENPARSHTNHVSRASVRANADISEARRSRSRAIRIQDKGSHPLREEPTININAAEPIHTVQCIQERSLGKEALKRMEEKMHGREGGAWTRIGRDQDKGRCHELREELMNAAEYNTYSARTEPEGNEGERGHEGLDAARRGFSGRRVHHTCAAALLSHARSRERAHAINPKELEIESVRPDKAGVRGSAARRRGACLPVGSARRLRSHGKGFDAAASTHVVLWYAGSQGCALAGAEAEEALLSLCACNQSVLWTGLEIEGGQRLRAHSDILGRQGSSAQLRAPSDRQSRRTTSPRLNIETWRPGRLNSACAFIPGPAQPARESRKSPLAGTMDGIDAD